MIRLLSFLIGRILIQHEGQGHYAHSEGQNGLIVLC